MKSILIQCGVAVRLAVCLAAPWLGGGCSGDSNPGAAPSGAGAGGGAGEVALAGGSPGGASGAASGGLLGVGGARAGSGGGASSGEANQAGAPTGGTEQAGGAAGGVTSGGSAGASGGANGGSAGAGNAYNPCPPAPADCKIMPFGDSITDGYLAQRGGYRIPLFAGAVREGKHLTFVGSAQNGPDMVEGVAFPRHHEGHSAFTINDAPSIPREGIAQFVAKSIPAYHPDIVLLMIGTNDVDNSLDLPNVPQRLGALIDSIVALDAHTLIVVAQITPTMQDPLNARIQTYNAALPAVVKSRADAGKHVVLVDMYGAFVADKAYRTTLLYDRLHPNIAGFQKMADTWNTVLHDLVR